MSTYHRRVATLEAGAGLSQTVDERDIAALGFPSILAAGLEFAERIAQRRLHHTVGPNWYRLDRDERRALARAELHAGVVAIRNAPDLHAGIRNWLASAESLPGVAWPDAGYNAFLAFLARDRHALDASRGSDDSRAVEWRSRNPSWHAGMVPDEADAWEASLGPSAPY